MLFPMQVSKMIQLFAPRAVAARFFEIILLTLKIHTAVSLHLALLASVLRANLGQRVLQHMLLSSPVRLLLGSALLTSRYPEAIIMAKHVLFPRQDGRISSRRRARRQISARACEFFWIKRSLDGLRTSSRSSLCISLKGSGRIGSSSSCTSTCLALKRSAYQRRP
jgi:hypothetical protein